MIAVSTVVIYYGCKNNDPTGSYGEDNSNPYGKGSLSFDAVDAGGHFSADSSYIPSNQFADDTLSRGAGGFVYDTTVSGRPLKARLSAYIHSFQNGLLNERLIVITLHNNSGSLSTGDYALTLSDSGSASITANIVFLFFSDSLAVYSVFEATSGTLSLTSFNADSNHLQGTFSGSLRGIPPDTSTHIQITNGLFDIYAAKHYFDY